MWKIPSVCSSKFWIVSGAQFLETALSTLIASYTTVSNTVFASLPVEICFQPLPVAVFLFQTPNFNVSLLRFIYNGNCSNNDITYKNILDVSNGPETVSIIIELFSITLSYLILHKNWSRMSRRQTLWKQGLHLFIITCPVPNTVFWG